MLRYVMSLRFLWEFVTCNQETKTKKAGNEEKKEMSNKCKETFTT
jgi:hypothetical protein